MYSVETSRKPGGTWTATLIVLALSISFGTRMSRVAKEPVGTSLGCRLTWACATRASSASGHEAMRFVASVFLSQLGIDAAPDGLRPAERRDALPGAARFARRVRARRPCRSALPGSVERPLAATARPGSGRASAVSRTAGRALSKPSIIGSAPRPSSCTRRRRRPGSSARSASRRGAQQRVGDRVVAGAGELRFQRQRRCPFRATPRSTFELLDLGERARRSWRRRGRCGSRWRRPGPVRPSSPAGSGRRCVSVENGPDWAVTGGA